MFMHTSDNELQKIISFRDNYHCVSTFKYSNKNNYANKIKISN